MRIGELKDNAREKLKGNWLKMIWPLFFISLFSSVFNTFCENLEETEFKLSFSIIALVGLVLSIYLSVVLNYGIVIRNLKISRNEEVNFWKDTFKKENRKRAWQVAWQYAGKLIGWGIMAIIGYILLFVSILLINFSEFISVGLLILVIAFVLFIFGLVKCVVKYYSYMLTSYLAYDYMEKGTKEIFTISEEKMDGYKVDGAIIPITFIGWWIVLLVITVILDGITFAIWPPQTTLFYTISTVPVIVTILLAMIILVMASGLNAYVNMTMCMFYTEIMKKDLTENQNLNDSNIEYGGFTDQYFEEQNNISMTENIDSSEVIKKNDKSGRRKKILTIVLLSILSLFVISVPLITTILTMNLQTPLEASYANYNLTIGGLQEKVTLAYGDVYTKHIISGKNKSRAQVCQEIATGVDVSDEANKYNKIVSEIYVEELPVIYNNNGDELEFYITSNADVFNFPAYDYDGKYYYCATVSSDDELDIDDVIELMEEKE